MKNTSIYFYLRAIYFYICNKPIILVYVVISLLSSLFPYFNTLLLNHIFKSIENHILLILFIFMLLYVGLQYIQRFISMLCDQLLLSSSFDLDNHMKKLVFESASYADTINYENEQWLKEYKRAERITGCVHDLFIATVKLISQLITFITYTVYLFRLISFYAFLGILILVPALVQSFVFSRQNYFHSRAVEMDRQRAGDIQKMFSKANTIREIKLYHSASEIIRKWKEKMRSIFSKKLHLEIRFSTYNSLLYGFTAAAVFIILSLVYLRIGGNNGSIGIMISLIPFMTSLVSSFHHTSNHVDGIIYSVQEYREICSFLTQNDANKQDSPLDTPFKGMGPAPIRVQNVGFKYPESDRKILKNVNFTIEQGETIALVGKNGSGKSTLLKIIAGIYSPNEGCVSYNDVEVSHLNASDIYSKISFVFQEPIHYPFNFKRNILLDAKEGYQNIDELMHQVNYDGSAESENLILTPGYKNSANLSGGQWQKICLARALKNKQAAVLLFDEPTASLDPKSELEIFKSFLSLAQGKSVILSTHRLGLAKQADKIVVMDQGQIVGEGTHEQLIRCCEVYRNLYEAQKSWYEYGTAEEKLETKVP